jgi:hypothetical protein
MFEAMVGNFAYSGDIHLFINVINGALVLYCEDAVHQCWPSVPQRVRFERVHNEMFCFFLSFIPQ